MKDIVGWTMTAISLLFVFFYTQSRLNRADRATLLFAIRDLVIDTESASVRSLQLPGTDGQQMNFYVEINSRFKRMQGLAHRLRHCRNATDISNEILDLKRIATGGDAQSVSRPASSPEGNRILAVGKAVNDLLELIDGQAAKKYWEN